jgi:hypothetical protein
MRRQRHGRPRRTGAFELRVGDTQLGPRARISARFLTRTFAIADRRDGRARRFTRARRRWQPGSSRDISGRPSWSTLSDSLTRSIRMKFSIHTTVVCGSNTSTLKQTTTAMKAAEAPEPSWSAEWIFGWSEAARWDGDNDTEPAGSRGCSLSFSCGPCADLRKCHPFAPAMTATGVF